MVLEERIRQQLIQMVKAYPGILRLYLFGSRARGDARPRSDIDLAVDAPSLTHRQWLELQDQIDEELDTLLKCDLLWLQKCDDELVKRIHQEGVILYERRTGPLKPDETGSSVGAIKGSD